MTFFSEVVFIGCAAKPVSGSSPSDTSNTVYVWDPRSGLVYGNYRDSCSGRLCITSLGSKREKNFLLSSRQDNRALINVYDLDREHAVTKLHPPENVGCMAVSPDGSLLVVGSKDSGKVFVWRICDGSLLASWNAHFKRVSDLKFTTDSEYIVTASEDTFVHVWQVARVLDVSSQEPELSAKIHSWSDHSLPITGIFVTPGLSRNSLILSYSLDRSAYLYDLETGLRVAEYFLSDGISCAVMDAVRSTLYFGLVNGNISAIPVKAEEENIQGDLLAKINDGIVMKGVHGSGSRISRLALSLDDSLLVSAGDDGLVVAWDCPSKVPTKTFELPQLNGSTVSDLILTLKPISLFAGSRTSGASTGNNDLYKAIFPPLQRMLASTTGDKFIKLTNWDDEISETDLTDQNVEESSMLEKLESLSSKSQNDLVTENQGLKDRISKLARINQTLYERVLKQ